MFFTISGQNVEGCTGITDLLAGVHCSAHYESQQQHTVAGSSDASM